MYIYEPKSFNSEQEKILRSIADKSFYQENFLSQDEFDYCRQLVLSVTDWPEHGKTSKYWGFGADTGLGPKLDWLLKKVKLLIPNCDLDFFAVQEAIQPWKIHADIRWYENKIPYKVILLPMDVEPDHGAVSVDNWPATYTITFDQRNFLSKWEEKSVAQNGNNDQSKWRTPIDNISNEGFVDGFHIAQDLWQQHFSHVPYEHLRGLTIDKVNQWKPRSLMYWDNTALHCADDFRMKNIRTKRSLMLFTNYLQ
jgi:hypothetical protein